MSFYKQKCILYVLKGLASTLYTRKLTRLAKLAKFAKLARVTTSTGNATQTHPRVLATIAKLALEKFTHE